MQSRRSYRSHMPQVNCLSRIGLQPSAHGMYNCGSSAYVGPLGRYAISLSGSMAMKHNVLTIMLPFLELMLGLVFFAVISIGVVAVIVYWLVAGVLVMCMSVISPRRVPSMSLD